MVKSRFDGFEFWNGRGWIDNKSLYKKLCEYDTDIESLSKAFFNISILLSANGLSTYTIALFKSPPLINPFSSNVSSSCRKLKVLADEISSLNSLI